MTVQLEKNLKAEAFGHMEQPMYALDYPPAEAVDYADYPEVEESAGVDIGDDDEENLQELMSLLDEGEAEPDSLSTMEGEPLEEISLEEFSGPTVPEGDVLTEPMTYEEESVLDFEDEEEVPEEQNLDDGSVTPSAIEQLLSGGEEGLLPGAQIMLVKPDEEPQRDTTWKDDSDHGKFLDYMAERLQAVPPHSGQTTVGCEKAISYLRKLDKEISKAIQSDEDNKIDESTAEKIT
jgi:hypothetical protein